MTQQWGVPAWAVVTATIVLSAVLVALAVTVMVLHRGTRAQRERLARAESAAAELLGRVDALERRPPAQRRSASTDQGEFVITEVATVADAQATERPEPSPGPGVPGPLFADLVLRESVVQAASLGAGVRRALQPGTRDRIRLEMRREVKRARRLRRREVRESRRAWSAGPHAADPAPTPASTAAPAEDDAA